jgi:hypothetical protein
MKPPIHEPYRFIVFSLFCQVCVHPVAGAGETPGTGFTLLPFRHLLSSRRVFALFAEMFNPDGCKFGVTLVIIYEKLETAMDLELHEGFHVDSY